VVPIVGPPNDPQIGGAGTAIEFAVRMHRFAEAGRLDHLCARGSAVHRYRISPPRSPLFTTARALQRCQRASANPNKCWRQRSRTSTSCRAAARATAEQRAWRGWLMDAQRVRPPGAALCCPQGAGRVRECHGDLHLGNLVLIDGRGDALRLHRVQRRLRWIDVASEIAFLYIDLLDQGQPASPAGC
jgi:aminoglycoside phosphotransferase family enzyme